MTLWGPVAESRARWYAVVTVKENKTVEDSKEASIANFPPDSVAVTLVEACPEVSVSWLERESTTPPSAAVQVISAPAKGLPTESKARTTRGRANAWLIAAD